jgi:hypothetical protein
VATVVDAVRNQPFDAQPSSEVQHTVTAMMRLLEFG